MKTRYIIFLPFLSFISFIQKMKIQFHCIAKTLAYITRPSLRLVSIFYKTRNYLSRLQRRLPWWAGSLSETKCTGSSSFPPCWSTESFFQRRDFVLKMLQITESENVTFEHLLEIYLKLVEILSLFATSISLTWSSCLLDDEEMNLKHFRYVGCESEDLLPVCN